MQLPGLPRVSRQPSEQTSRQMSAIQIAQCGKRGAANAVPALVAVEDLEAAEG